MFARPARGFTLIETLVVLSISVGLVITMALLFRATGHTTLLLRGSNNEWELQIRLREQLRHLFILPDTPAITGTQNQITLLAWQGFRDGHAGKPVVAQYRHVESERIVYYREAPLPAWWGETPRQADILHALANSPEIRLASGIEDLKLYFVPREAQDLAPSRQQAHWQANDPPRTILLAFSRAARNYNLFLETRGLPALPNAPTRPTPSPARQ